MLKRYFYIGISILLAISCGHQSKMIETDANIQQDFGRIITIDDVDTLHYIDSELPESFKPDFLKIEKSTQQVSLSWNPGRPFSQDLKGYKVYYGTEPGSYSDSIDAGFTHFVTIDSLLDSTHYYFAASAYDTAGNESDFSNEIDTTIIYQLQGDYDLNGFVDFDDLIYFINNLFGRSK